MDNGTPSAAGRVVEYRGWRIHAFDCFPNGERETWFMACNGGRPNVYGSTPRRLLAAMKASENGRNTILT